MTHITRETKNPLTHKWEMALYIDDHFGPGQCGVKFSDGSIYNPLYTKLKVREYEV